MATNSQPTCPQCEANAKTNEAGGYHSLAEECREYCRRGHKPPQATQPPERIWIFREGASYDLAGWQPSLTEPPYEGFVRGGYIPYVRADLAPALPVAGRGDDLTLARKDHAYAVGFMAGVIVATNEEQSRTHWTTSGLHYDDHSAGYKQQLAAVERQRAEALKAMRAATPPAPLSDVWDEAIQIVKGEMVNFAETNDPGDFTYNTAIEHAVSALEAARNAKDKLKHEH